ncbi:MAG TPA: tetratricopeptide repeat protein, partial [Kofleriaceae bacterium]
AMGYISLAGAAGWVGNAAEAAEILRKLGVLEAAIGIEHATPMAIESDATAAQQLGQFSRAIDLEQRAYAMLRSSSHGVAEEVSVLFNVAAAYELAGDSPNMLVYNEKRLAMMPEEPALERAYVMENIGVAHSRMGHAAPAIDWLTKAVALYTKLGKPADPQNAKIGLASAYVQAGRLHDARVLSEKLLPEIIATEPPRPWRRATTELSLARSLWEEGDAHERAHALVIAADAERDFVDAIDQLSKIPMANASVAILQVRLADLRAWRAKHPG